MLHWRALAASARGASHRRDGTPNQDAVLTATLPGAAIAAVADGHGAARHCRSADGAQLAVRAAQHLLAEAAPRLDAASRDERLRLAATELPQRIVERWVEAARADLAERPLGVDEIERIAAVDGAEAAAALQADPLLAYGTTLLAACAGRHGLVLLQLGDGDMLLVDADGHTRRPLPADERLGGNLTTSICRAGAEADFRCAVIDAGDTRPALLLLSTDGYANSFRSDADYLQLGADFLALLRRHGVDAVQAQLPGILDDASAHGSGDDVTLAMLVGDLDPAAATAVDAEPGAGASTAARASAAEAALAAAEARIARQRRWITVLTVALLAMAGWTQRDRFAPGVTAAPQRGASAPASGLIPAAPAAGDGGLLGEAAAPAASAASAPVLAAPGAPRGKGGSAAGR